MLLIYASVLLVSVHTVHSSTCTAFSVSECTGDANAIYLELNTSRDKCQQYCAIEEQCKFYRYSDKPVQGVNCLLYQEPFRTYIGHCNVRSGPKEVAPNCLEPTEDSCDVVQGGKCIYTGVTVESFDSLQMEECMALCAINPNCKLWVHEKESTECQLLDSSEIICLETFGPRSSTPTECGEGSEPSTTENPDQSTPKDPINCPDDAELQLFPDPDDCESYWECYRGRVSHMTCSDCYQFDAEHSWCSPPDIVECGARPEDQNCQSTTAPGPCPYPTGYFQDPENCKQYFVCEQGTPQSAVCEVKADSNNINQQLLYNYEVIQCDWPNRVNCAERPICDDNYEHCQCQGAPIVDPEHKCPPGSGAKVLGDPFNCNISLVCIDGTLSTTVNCEKEKPFYDEKRFGCSSDPAVCELRPICSDAPGVAGCYCYN